MKGMYHNVCPDLIVRTDHGHSSHPDYKHISMCECKAFKENRPCRYRGNCIAGRDSDTGRKVNSKTWSTTLKANL